MWWLRAKTWKTKLEKNEFGEELNGIRQNKQILWWCFRATKKDLPLTEALCTCRYVPVDRSKTIICSTVIAYALWWFLLWKYLPVPVSLSVAVWAIHSHSLSPLCAQRWERCILRSTNIPQNAIVGKYSCFQSNYYCSSYREESHSFLWVHSCSRKFTYTLVKYI
jgi:hypothetical protein